MTCFPPPLHLPTATASTPSCAPTPTISTGRPSAVRAALLRSPVFPAVPSTSAGVQVTPVCKKRGQVDHNYQVNSKKPRSQADVRQQKIDRVLDQEIRINDILIEKYQLAVELLRKQVERSNAQ